MRSFYPNFKQYKKLIIKNKKKYPTNTITLSKWSFFVADVAKGKLKSAKVTHRSGQLQFIRKFS